MINGKYRSERVNIEAVFQYQISRNDVDVLSKMYSERWVPLITKPAFKRNNDKVPSELDQQTNWTRHERIEIFGWQIDFANIILLFREI